MLNRGVSFGWFAGIEIWVVVGVWLLVLWLLVKEKWGRGGLALILLGGGINLLMRLVYGGVIDNWSLRGMLYNNLADYLIIIGLCIYGYTYFVRRRRNSRS
ncbi:MAG: signal peptidase II [bacterium]